MFEFEVVPVAGHVALEELHRRLADHAHTGLYPILIGDKQSVRYLAESPEARGPNAILAAAGEIDVQQWFREQREDLPELYDFPTGDWPYDPSLNPGMVTHIDLRTGEPLREVMLALLPIQDPADAFAHLRFGYWNDCPTPEVHVAVHRYWQQTYGAHVVSITSDVVQCFVANPPGERSTAIELANEHGTYCYDITHQGTGTITRLGATLLHADTWYFWWD